MACLFMAGALPKLRGDPEEKKLIAALGLPGSGVLEITAGICQAAGAGMLLLGVGTRLAAALLACFVVAVTPLYLRFWVVDDPRTRQQIMQGFFANAGVTAGLLAICVTGAGNWALESPY